MFSSEVSSLGVSHIGLLLLSFLCFQHISSQPVERDSKAPSQIDSTSGSGIRIVQFRSEEKMVKQETFPPRMVSDAPPVLKPDPNVGRRVDRNEPMVQTISRDRSERKKELGQLPQRSIPPWFVKAFSFQAEMKNETAKPIVRFVWAYQPPSDPQQTPGKEYLCNSRIEPGAIRAVKVISPIPRARVVEVSDSDQPPVPLDPSLKDLSIRYVRFADGSTWQHPDWNSTILLRREGIRKLGKGKCAVL